MADADDSPPLLAVLLVHPSSERSTQETGAPTVLEQSHNTSLSTATGVLAIAWNDINPPTSPSITALPNKFSVEVAIRGSATAGTASPPSSTGGWVPRRTHTNSAND